MEQTNSILGVTTKGPIFAELSKRGLTHDNYKINLNMDESQLIGAGAQNKVYKNGNQVQKVPHLGSSKSWNNKLKSFVETSHLDHLIHQYEKVLSIRVYNCVNNKYNNNFLYFNKDKRSKIPLITSLNPHVDENAIINEDLVTNTKNPVKNIEREVAQFLPKIIKELFLFFDTRGGVQAYKVGEKYGRPEFVIMDGVDAFKPKNDTNEIYEENKHKFGRFTSEEKAKEQIDKYRKIVTECSEQQKQIMFKEIENTFRNYTEKFVH